MFTRLAAALALSAAVSLPALAESLTVINKSEYDIHELYISSARSKDWGPDQLRKNVVGPNERFTINNIPVGRYDLRLIDEDGTECNVEDIDFSTGKEWTVTTAMLERCDKFGR